MTAVASRVEAHISGTVTGQIAVGNHIIQNNVDHGGVVFVAAPGEIPTPRARPRPVVLRGRRAPEVLGRDEEVQAALDALGQATPVEFVGPVGIGKTTVLKYLCHTVPEALRPDGVVYHEAYGEPVEDILQFLYEAFYETTVPFKPTEAQLLHALRDLRPLVVLDDLDAGRSGTGQILDSMPAANFVLAGVRRALWFGGGESLTLRGLSPEAAVELLARKLWRELDAGVREVAGVIAEALNGHPLQLLQAAALVTELGYGLTEVADDLRAGSAPDELGRLLLESLDGDQRAILEALGALGGATLTADQLAELTGVADAGPVVESLLQLGLVQAHSPRYSVASAGPPETMAARAGRDGDQRGRAHMIRWLEAHRHQSGVVVEETQAVLAVLHTAARDQAWDDLLRVARAAEGPLLLERRWGAWREVLDHELTAARRLGDRAAEGWALHQLGSRALCLDDRWAAQTALADALRIREGIGDHDGALVTRHNLELLVGGGGTRGPAGRWAGPVASTPAPLLGPPFMFLVGVVALMVAFIGGVLVAITTPERADGGSARSSFRTEPSSVEFGAQAVGTPSTSRFVTVTNDGSSPLRILSAGVAGPGQGSYGISDDRCSSALLDRGSNCSISVTFTPVALGVQQATLTVVGEGTEPQRVSLSGTGRGRLRVEPTTVDFGTVTMRTPSPPRLVTVTNDGSSPLRILSAGFAGPGDDSYDISDDRCTSALLGPGRNCSISVTFTPVALGLQQATLTVVGEGTEPQRVSLSGTGRPNGGRLVLEPTTVDFGTVTLNESASRTVRVRNEGDAQVRLGEATVTGAGFSMAGTDCPPALAADCTVTVRFTPLAPGKAVGALVVTNIDTREEPGAFLTGVGVDLPLKAHVSIHWPHPLVEIQSGSIARAEARLVQTGGTKSDLMLARVVFEVERLLPQKEAPTSEPADRDPTTPNTAVFAKQLPLGVYAVRARLVETPSFRMVPPKPVAILVVTDVVGATVYTLSDLLALLNLP